MSFFDDASLVFLPSGQAGKDGKAYSMKPTNGDGDFTFSRGSNLTATRVDSNGLIEKGRENLLLQSNQFDTTWLQTSCSVTSGQSGYDGSSDAWLLSKSNANGRLRQYVTNTGVQTLSAYFKAGTKNWMRITYGGKTTYFDLSNGVLGNDNSIDATITSVASGWYRCTFTANVTSAQYAQFYVADSDGDTSGTSGNIYIQDAQLEQGLVATEYIESGATTGLAGILEDSPRFDYSGGASCPSLLLEPSRTNLLQSEYFDGWNLFNEMTPTANNATSPEGLQNAYKMETTAAGAYFRDAQTLTAGNNVFSIFVKRGNSQYIFLRTRFFTGGDNADVWFDVQNGTKGGNLGDSVTYDIEDYGNGWYRCYLVHNVDAGDLFGYAYVGLTNTDEDTSGESSLNGYFYGGQWEAGSYETSYIPNHSGGSVTRDADDCGGAGTSSTFNDDEGVLFIELETTKNSSPAQITINDGTYSNRVIFEVRPDAAFIKALINSRGTNVYDQSVSSSPNTNYKVAIKYSANDIAFFVNGVKEASTTTTTAMPTGLNDLSYTGKENDGALRFLGNIKQTLVFPEALSTTDCEILTGATSYESFSAMATALNYTTYE